MGRIIIVAIIAIISALSRSKQTGIRNVIYKNTDNRMLSPQKNHHPGETEKTAPAPIPAQRQFTGGVQSKLSVESRDDEKEWFD